VLTTAKAALGIWITSETGQEDSPIWRVEVKNPGLGQFSLASDHFPLILDTIVEME